MTTTGRKLIVGAAVIVAVTAYMAYLGGSASWQYYLTADECLQQGGSLVGSRVRISGPVAPGTLQVTGGRTEAQFALEAETGLVHVIYSGTLPDNFAEGREVVVEGQLEKPSFLQADLLMTRCASKYKAESNRRRPPKDRIAMEAGS